MNASYRCDRKSYIRMPNQLLNPSFIGSLSIRELATSASLRTWTAGQLTCEDQYLVSRFSY